MMGPYASRAGAALLLALTACEHSVVVLAPARDVPAQTPVAAAVTAGGVKRFDAGAVVKSTGVVVRGGREVAHLEPTDLLEIAAHNGDQFGTIRVRRKPMYEAVSLLGVLILVGGTLASWGVAGACISPSQDVGASSGDSQCVVGGLVGTLVVVGIGGPVLAWGVHGELVTSDHPRVSFAPGRLTVRF